MLLGHGPLTQDRVTIPWESGVDADMVPPLPDPPTPSVVAALVGRMLDGRGVRMLVVVWQELRAQGTEIRLHLVGLLRKASATPANRPIRFAPVLNRNLPTHHAPVRENQLVLLWAPLASGRWRAPLGLPTCGANARIVAA